MIEVEIRGRLAKEEFEHLMRVLETDGKHLGHQDREMYLLYDYPGYADDPIQREVDIRLRRTNDEAEIMVKKKVSEGNVGRKEISLKLGSADLDVAKQVLKALGYTKGLRMQRTTELYQYKDVTWSLVSTPKEYYYFEAEKESPLPEKAKEVEAELRALADEMSLKVLSLEETKDFIAFLDKEVNLEVEF